MEHFKQSKSYKKTVAMCSEFETTMKMSQEMLHSV